jgi:hypothetical protein
MKIKIALFALLFASLCSAEEPASVTSRKLADCTVPEVVSIESYEANRRAADLAPAILPLIDKMKALANKAPDPKRSVGEQLSGKDNEEFGEIRSRMMTLQWHELIESRYEKHLELIETMTESVDTIYRWGRYPDAKDPNLMADVTPSALQQLEPIKTFDAPKEEHCTLIWALHMQEQPSLVALNDPSLDAASNQTNQLSRKYHTDHLDRSVMSRDDQQILDEVQTVITRMQREESHAEQIEQIKTMAEAADLIYQVSMKDFDRSGGDPDASIDTLQQMKKDGTLTTRMAQRIAAWSKLDEKYPSDQALGLQEAAKAMSGTQAK